MLTPYHIMRTEITGNIELESNESNLLDNHSLLNLFNVLENQLQELWHENALHELQTYDEFCIDILLALTEDDFDNRLPEIEERFDQLLKDLRSLAQTYPGQRIKIDSVTETVGVAISRINEFRADRFRWTRIPCNEFHRKLERFLSVTEKLAYGKFHFVYAPEDGDRNGYRIDFQIDCPNNFLFAPPILHDTIRDLTANARKYSPPGSEITLQLQQTDSGGIRFSIRDHGMGIPPQEIAKTVRFGYRASNSQYRRTMGGGFGLTKAYQLCQRFHGRFFIDSTLDSGTTVEFTLLPPDSAALSQ